MALEVKFYPTEIAPYLVAHGGLRALVPDEEAIVYGYGEELLRGIVSSWPVDTGTSQDAFSFYTSGDPGEGFGIVVENPMYYAEYVHLAGTAPEPPLWRTLFPAVWAPIKPRLLAELFAAIRSTERERASREAGKVARGETPAGARRAASRELSGFGSALDALLKRLR